MPSKTRLSDPETERRAATVRLLNNPDQWNNLVLPVFRWTPDHSKALAVVVPPIVCPTYRVYVDANLFNLNAIKWDNAEAYIEYQTADQIVAAGWLVD